MENDLPENWTHAQDFINPLLDKAVAAGVSDLHFERAQNEGIIRVRLDGMMRVWARMNMEKMALILSRVKFISGIDPMQKGVLQQGRFAHDHHGEGVDMRVSILPTPHWDDLVIRVLASAPEVMKLDEMNFLPPIVEGLRRAVAAHQGFIIVTGPTGSGKTTTLYAAVEEINDGERKIITVEDPIEYQVEGLTQIKLNRQQNLDYAGILKTILRHDPDVIMVGETRDLEAAEIAVEASMTGHLVLTTMHTNSAAATILRMINMGITPQNVANSITALYAQRLLKKLCPHCKEKAAAPTEMADYMGQRLEETPLPDHIFTPKGCEKCDGTGYHGRIPISELILMDDTLRDVILESPTLTALNKAVAQMSGTSLMDNGAMLTAQGLVDYHDVVNAVGYVAAEN